MFLFDFSDFIILGGVGKSALTIQVSLNKILCLNKKNIVF
jgi:hypothetical protein